jgi:broad specificity phosphatase PhoE
MSMIYTIRHAQASFGKEDYDQLSPLGTKQARILAQHLLDIGFHPDAVYAGSMARQTGTAEEVLSAYRAARKSVPELELLSGFNEYNTASIVTALFPGMVKEDPSLNDDLPRMYVSKDAFKRVFEGAMLRWVTGAFDTPEFESWEALKARVAESLHLIMKRHGRGKTILVFTSGGTIAASLSYVLGVNSIAHLELAGDPTLITYR